MVPGRGPSLRVQAMALGYEGMEHPEPAVRRREVEMKVPSLAFLEDEVTAKWTAALAAGLERPPVPERAEPL